MDQAALRRLLADQAEVFRREQWYAVGGDRAALQTQLDARRWRALNDAVVVAHNGPLTRQQQLWAVVLGAQPPAALASLTAMELLGVRGFETTSVHVLVRRGARVLPLLGVAVDVHESRRFDTGDVVPRLPPTTTLERAVVDAASWAPDIWTAFRIAVAPVQQRLTTGDRLLETLLAQGRIRFLRPLQSFLADVSGGAQALSEVAFVRWCRRHGFPKPRLQVRTDVRGRRRYLDAWFQRPDGSTLWVEIDGGVHLSLATRWEDQLKDNDAWLSGRRGLRLVSTAIYGDDPRAVEQLRQALGIVSTSVGNSQRTC